MTYSCKAPLIKAMHQGQSPSGSAIFTGLLSSVLYGDSSGYSPFSGSRFNLLAILSTSDTLPTTPANSGVAGYH